MVPYILLCLLPILGSVFQRNRKKKNDGSLIWIFFIFLIVLLSLRSVKTGVDLSNYLTFFGDIAKEPFSKNWTKYGDLEIGYLFLNNVIALFTDNSQIFLTLIAIISVLPICCLYAKESESALLSIAIFLILPNFSMLFSGLRQAIAISIGAMSFYYVKKKKILPFILTIAIACSFHRSALVLLFLYPVYYLNITKKWLLWFLPLIAVTFIFNRQIFYFLLRFLGEKYQERYSALSVSNAYGMLILFIIFLLYAFFVPRTSSLDRETIGLRNILICSVFIQLFAPIHAIAMRFNYYFLIFLPILIPKIVNRCQKEDALIINFSKIAMIAFFMSYFVYNGYFGADILQVYPYIPFWVN